MLFGALWNNDFIWSDQVTTEPLTPQLLPKALSLVWGSLRWWPFIQFTSELLAPQLLPQHFSNPPLPSPPHLFLCKIRHFNQMWCTLDFLQNLWYNINVILNNIYSIFVFTKTIYNLWYDHLANWARFARLWSSLKSRIGAQERRWTCNFFLQLCQNQYNLTKYNHIPTYTISSIFDNQWPFSTDICLQILMEHSNL